MDMLPLHARFATQDQAESVIRKLTALRGDEFRLERIADYPDKHRAPSLTAADSVDGVSAAIPAIPPMQPFDATTTGVEMAAEPLGSLENHNSAAAFVLSLNIPGAAAEQAVSVIRQAGGRVG